MPDDWPFIPARVSETLRFSTRIEKTPTKEFREDAHDAVQFLRLVHEEEDQEAGRIQHAFRQNMAGEWYVPLWHDMDTLASVDYTDAILYVDTSADYRAGGFCIVWGSNSDYVIAEIASVGAASITLTEPVGQNFAGPVVLVAPVITARAVEPLGLNQVYGKSSLAITFRATEFEDLDPGAAIFAVYSSYQVVPASRDYMIGEGLAVSHFQETEIIADGQGRFTFETYRDLSESRHTLRMRDTTRALRWEWRQWLHQIRGRNEPFWLPSNKGDLVLQEAVDAAETSIDLDRVTATPADLVGQYIYLDNGTTNVVRQITAALNPDADTTRITIAATGAAFAQTDRIGFAWLVRFDSDEMQLEHMRTPDGFFTTHTATVIEVPG